MLNSKPTRSTFLFAVFVTLGFSAGASASSVDPVIVLGERVTLEFNGTRGDVALSALETNAGITIDAPSRVSDDTITLSLEHVTVDEAVKKVLRALSFRSVAVIYQTSGAGVVEKRFVAFESGPPAEVEPIEEPSDPDLADEAEASAGEVDASDRLFAAAVSDEEPSAGE